MAIFTLFDRNEIAPIFDEIQGYSMAICASFDQHEIASIFDEKQSCRKAVL